jgi:dTDP-4-dehydrorhamnose 3,5-epimerase-like enzyme
MTTTDQAYWIDFQDVKDDRGRLTALEVHNHIPFEIKRLFYVHQVEPGVDRAGHAHRETDQVLTVVHGMLNVEILDGKTSREYPLTDPGKGLYVPRMIWIRLHDFSEGAVCLVAANTIYDRSKSIRTWKDFAEARGLAAKGN